MNAISICISCDPENGGCSCGCDTCITDSHSPEACIHFVNSVNYPEDDKHE